MTLWLLTHPAIANRKAEDSLGASPTDDDDIGAQEVLRATSSVCMPTKSPHVPNQATSGSALRTTARAPTAIARPDIDTKTASIASARATPSPTPNKPNARSERATTPPLAICQPQTARRPHRMIAVAAMRSR